MALRLTEKKKKRNFIVLNQGVTEKEFGVCDSVSPFHVAQALGLRIVYLQHKEGSWAEGDSPKDRQSCAVQTTSDLPWAGVENLEGKQFQSLQSPTMFWYFLCLRDCVPSTPYPWSPLNYHSPLRQSCWHLVLLQIRT